MRRRGRARPRGKSGRNSRNDRALPQHDLPRTPGGPRMPPAEPTISMRRNFKTVFAPPPTVSIDPVVNPGPVASTSRRRSIRTAPGPSPGSNTRQTTATVGVPPVRGTADPGPLWCETYGGDDTCSKPLFGNTTQAFNRTINEPNINSYYGVDPVPLEPNTNYIVRLHAENPGGAVTTAAAPFKQARFRLWRHPSMAALGLTEPRSAAESIPKFSCQIRVRMGGQGRGRRRKLIRVPRPALPKGLPVADNALHTVSTAGDEPIAGHRLPLSDSSRLH